MTYNGTPRPSKAPNLPIAPVEYAQSYQDQLLNALRLYFNQIDNATATITGTLAVNQGGTGMAAGYTVATLPTAGTKGRRSWVNDALAPTFGAAPTGGGTVVIPVFDNGTAWIVG
jgi:hypothetical protein